MNKVTNAIVAIGGFLLGNYLTGLPIWKAIFKKVASR